jgi:ATP-dependent RNA/DNA helicase IGHMBP2
MNEAEKAYLEKLHALLKAEEEEDRLQYIEKTEKVPLQGRRLQGLCWYPLVIKESYYGTGDRLFLEIERPTDQDLPHQFSNGRSVSLFCRQEGHDEPPLKGVVSAVRENQLRLMLYVDELPEWVQRGKLGLDLLFDEGSYKEMYIALKKLGKAENNRLAQLRSVLYGNEKPVFNEIEPVLIPGLNDSQNQAVTKVLSASDVAVIHGPPGTGKTTTLTGAILETLKTEAQVLVCAPSNNAVDLLTEKLHARGINVLRFGNPARINENMLSHTIDHKIGLHREYKTIRTLKKRANEFRSLASRYKRNFGKSERDQRKLLYSEAHKMLEEAANIEDYIIDDLTGSAQVITCTLVGSANHLLREKEFSTVFIDEAAQALEPACWVAISRAHRVIFAGDHFQLPPTVKSLKSATGGLNHTLFEKCAELPGVASMLKVQYRMNEDIMNFSGKEFYEGKLLADDNVTKAVLAAGSGRESLENAFAFIDTAGCGFGEITEPGSSSTSNPEEAQLLLKCLHGIYNDLKETGNDPGKFSTGIISPYKAQVMKLKDYIAADELLSPALAAGTISVNTVDGFQGQERDMILISLVRSNNRCEIGFLEDYRRMNVALTRAKKKLLVLGDSATLGANHFYRRFLEYAESIDAYKSAWEYQG